MRIKSEQERKKQKGKEKEGVKRTLSNIEGKIHKSKKVEKRF